MYTLITGSAGFIGTNLVNRLLKQKKRVLAIDNFSSSDRFKAELFVKDENYRFIEADSSADLATTIGNSDWGDDQMEQIYNLACPASPPRYTALPIETIKVCVDGTINALELAKKHNAKILHTSTSEVYGDPEVHPQPESYRGNVNTIGPRSCYDEGKRISESICYEYSRLYGVDIKLVRLFNTYGPYMDPDDGRVITNFIKQALRGEDITVYGEGQQTRSFQFIDDLLNAFELIMDKNIPFQAVNLGNPKEFTILELAQLVLQKIPTKSKIVYEPLPQDDPKVRQPNISKAQQLLGWEPKVALNDGLDKTIEYYKNLLK